MFYLFLANERVDGRGYQRKVWDPMLVWGLMMVVVEEMERKVEAKYVEKDYLKVSFYCLYPLKVSLVTALQRS
jgi:hypothetical protein